MQISKEMLEKYKVLFKEEFGKDLSDQDALEQATKLLTLVKEVYKPIDRKNPTRDDLENCYKKAEDSLHKLSKTVLDGLKPPAGACAFFNHNAHALSRLQDCNKILKRLFSQREELSRLAKKEDTLMPKDHPPGVPFPEEVQKVMKEEGIINSYMQLDLESLYIFGGILLDQWSIQAINVGDLKVAKKHPFPELLFYLEKNQDQLLGEIWEKLSKKMLWLHYQMRFYRNRFIVHANRPWQRGTTRSRYGDDYNLHTPTPPGWDNDEELDREIKKLIHLAPENIKNAPDDYWEKSRAGALIERLFENIPNIENPEDRQKISNLFGRKGGVTPTFQVLARRLFEFIEEGTEILSCIAGENLDKIDIGRPYATSDEMHKNRKKEK